MLQKKHRFVLFWWGCCVLTMSLWADDFSFSAPVRQRPAQSGGVAAGAEAVQASLISVRAREKFCLDLRGWAVPTEHVFHVFERALHKKTLDDEGLTVIRFWLDRGFGYAIGALLEQSFPRHMPRFRQLVEQEYPGTNVICPLACTYRDYVELDQVLSGQDKQQLYTTCIPNCHLRTTRYDVYDTVFCKCLYSPELSQCEILSSEDLQGINHARMHQEASLRDYAFRSKGERFTSQNVAAIENMKKGMMSNLTRAMRR